MQTAPLASCLPVWHRQRSPRGPPAASPPSAPPGCPCRGAAPLPLMAFAAGAAGTRGPLGARRPLRDAMVPRPSMTLQPSWGSSSPKREGVAGRGFQSRDAGRAPCCGTSPSLPLAAPAAVIPCSELKISPGAAAAHRHLEVVINNPGGQLTLAPHHSGCCGRRSEPPSSLRCRRVDGQMESCREMGTEQPLPPGCAGKLRHRWGSAGGTMGPFACDAGGEGIGPVLIQGWGRTNPCAHVTVSHIHLSQIHPFAAAPSPAAEPASCSRPGPLRWIRPFAPAPSFFGSFPWHQIHPTALNPPCRLDPSCRGSVPLPRSSPSPALCLFPHHPPRGGQGLSPSLPPPHPTVPAPASHAHSELGQFSCTSGSSTSRPDPPRPWGVGCWRGVPCWKGVLVHSHRPIDAEHAGGAPSLPAPSPFSPHRSPGGAAKAQGKRGQARRE